MVGVKKRNVTHISGVICCFRSSTSASGLNMSMAVCPFQYLALIRVPHLLSWRPFHPPCRKAPEGGKWFQTLIFYGLYYLDTFKVLSANFLTLVIWCFLRLNTHIHTLTYFYALSKPPPRQRLIPQHKAKWHFLSWIALGISDISGPTSQGCSVPE